MVQKTLSIKFPKAEDIQVKYEVDKVLDHPFDIWVGEAIILSLTYDEAVALQDKIGFAIQDYNHNLTEGGK